MRLEAEDIRPLGEKKIVFFDGHCNLCNAWVDWLMRRDRLEVLNYASLQGETARKILGSVSAEPTTIIYFRHGQRFVESTAVLRILSDLGGFWKLSKILLFIPPGLRDRVYRWLARRRYQIFGRRETCRLPTEKEKHRLLP